jgi:hypothetical protein
MGLDVTKEVVALRRMTVPDLRRRYAEVFGEQTRCRHKEYLWRRIIWRLQAIEEGDLSERARRRAGADASRPLFSFRIPHSEFRICAVANPPAGRAGIADWPAKRRPQSLVPSPKSRFSYTLRQTTLLSNSWLKGRFRQRLSTGFMHVSTEIARVLREMRKSYLAHFATIAQNRPWR